MGSIAPSKAAGEEMNGTRLSPARRMPGCLTGAPIISARLQIPRRAYLLMNWSTFLASITVTAKKADLVAGSENWNGWLFIRAVAISTAF